MGDMDPTENGKVLVHGDPSTTPIGSWVIFTSPEAALPSYEETVGDQSLNVLPRSGPIFHKTLGRHDGKKSDEIPVVAKIISSGPVTNRNRKNPVTQGRSPAF